MLVHLVGDLHCPMHAGHKSDLGGNTVSVLYFDTPTKLHTIWDTQLVESAHKWSYTEWQRQIDRVTRKQEKELSGSPRRQPSAPRYTRSCPRARNSLTIMWPSTPP